MANRLYPPLIEGTIPAFYDVSKLVVPYSNNRTVGGGDYKGFVLKINTVRSNNCLGTVQQTGVFSLTSVAFDVSSLANVLKVGQSYKIQIAYIGTDNVVGYFSTVGVIKYTAKPTVEIGGLKPGTTNYTQKTYTGIYTNEQDTTEKVYNYRFVIRDADDNVIEDSGFLLHDSSLDESSGSSVDSYYTKHNLESNESCTIQYMVITSGNMTLSTPRYRIIGNYTAEPQTYIRLQAILNYDNGYIDLVMRGESNSGGEVPTSGNFVLSRKDLSADGRWEDIHLFVLNTELPSKHTLRDFTIWQGHNYIYSIQQYNSHGIYTDRIVSNEVFADFEDAFLYDGQRQLRIRFNPKISSFKTDLLESKIDTIGGKYPFIFRNGNTYYKEFPISGLISYLSDNDQLFMTNKELAVRADNYTRQTTDANANISEFLRTTDLLGYNIAAERGFKLAVLDWLNNGEVKLFRSPGEGNYIVRLLNNSLTPTDSLGRMLHTFSSTAYEMCDYSLAALSQYGFINVTDDGELDDMIIQRQKSIKVSRNASATNGWVPSLTGGDAIQGFIAEDLLPGTPLRITFVNDPQDPIIVYVGTTGTYSAYGLGEIGQVEIKEEYLNLITNGDQDEFVLMTAIYNEQIQSKDSFALLDSIESITNPVRTFFGPQEDNIINQLTDVKISITKFIDLLFCLRPIEEVYFYDGAYYFDINGTMPLRELNPYALYRIKKIKTPSEIPQNRIVFYENQVKYDKEGNVITNAYIPPEGWEIVAENNGITVDSDWVSNIYYFDRNKNYYFKVDQEMGYGIDGEPTYIDRYIDGSTGYIGAFILDPTFKYNGDNAEETIDLTDIKVYEVHGVNDVKSITLGNGVYLHCAYQARQSCFALENNNEEIRALKENWLSKVAQLDNIYNNIQSSGNINNWSSDEARIKNKINEIKIAYNSFIDALAEGIEKYKKEMGLDYDI